MFNKNLNFLLLSSLVLLWATGLKAGDARSTFLSQGPGARAGSLGGAYTSLADDATALYYNPAGLPSTRGTFEAEHTPIIEGGRYNFLGLHMPSQIGSFGFGIIQYASGDIETRRAIGDDSSTTHAAQTAWILPYANALHKIRYGFSLNKIDYALDNKQDSAYGLNAGLLGEKNLNDIWGFSNPLFRIGFSIRNINNPSISPGAAGDRLPRETALGFSLQANVAGRYNTEKKEMVYNRTLVTLDLVRSNDGNKSFFKSPTDHLSPRAGFEYQLMNLVCLRAGLSKDWTLGLGIGSPDGPFRLDYALLFNDVQPQNRFSFSYFFTPPIVSNSSSPSLRQYTLIDRDRERNKSKFMAEGKKAASIMRYEDAATAFEKARVLDPDDSSLKIQLEQSLEALHLATINLELKEAGENFKAGLDREAFGHLTQAIEANPNDRNIRDFISNIRLSQLSANPNRLAQFETFKEFEMNRIQGSFETALKNEDVRLAKQLVDEAKTWDPDGSYSKGLESELSSVEIRLFGTCLDRAAVLQSHDEATAAALMLNRAAWIDPHNIDLKRARATLEGEYKSKNHFKPYDDLYQNQLYASAALHFVRSETPDCLNKLTELLNQNALHPKGIFLRQLLMDKKIIKEEVTQ